MRFAYADPPYPGQAYQYRGHPDYAGEVDHAELIARLEREYPDGWALSTNATAIQYVLSLCPSTIRVAVWHRTNAAPPGAKPGWWWDWEPVIVNGGRPSPVRAVFSSALNNDKPGTTGRFLGAKPAGFTRWMLGLLGAEIDDEIDDLFPGSGAVGREIESWRRHPKLPTFVRSELDMNSRTPSRLARDLRLAGHPNLFTANELSCHDRAIP